MALATAIDDERRRRSTGRLRLHAQADDRFHGIRRRLGGWLESLGRRLQRPAHAS